MDIKKIPTLRKASQQEILSVSNDMHAKSYCRGFHYFSAWVQFLGLDCERQKAIQKQRWRAHRVDLYRGVIVSERQIMIFVREAS